MISPADGKETSFEPGGACPVFSPNGRWAAYTAVVPGSPPQVLVKPTSGSGGKVQITSDRGAYPVWTDKGLYFLADRKVVMAEVQTQPTFKPGPLRELFEIPYDRGSLPLRNYDVTRDGQTFVFLTASSGGAWRQVNVLLDWASALPRIAPPGKK